MATKLLPVGSEFQVNSNIFPTPSTDGTLNSQDFPSIATLSDGRYAVVYQSALSATDIDIHYAFVTTAGVASQSDFVYRPVSIQSQPVAAGRTAATGGGFGVAWTDERTAANVLDPGSKDINYRTVSPTGVLGPVVAIADGLGDDASPAITTLSDGRQVVVLADNIGGTEILLNVVNSAGTGTLFAANNLAFVTAGASDHPSVAAQGTNALVAFEDTSALGSSDISARIFNGTSNTLGAAILIANDTAALFNPDVAAIGGGRYAIVYSDHVSKVFAKIYDPAFGVLSPEIRVDQTSVGATNQPAVAATIDGGFIVTWTDGGDAHERRFDPYGNAFGDDFFANTTTTLTQHRPDVAVIGTNVLTAWGDNAPHPGDSSSFGVRAQASLTQVFDYNDQAYGDFDANGRSDFLFQNAVTHQAQILTTSNTGVLNGITNLPNLAASDVIDGTGNFNSTPGSDLLLVRNTTTIGDWAMNGLTTNAVFHTFGGIPSTASYQGSGDFDGDGQTDILFLAPTPSGLQLVPWKIVNDALVATPQGIGGFDSSHYNIVAISDFDGDHNADIVFRSSTGPDVNKLFEWKIVNNQLVAAPFEIGTAPQGAHVVGIGDFDGNGTTDLLFRFDQTVGTSQPGQLAMWLLNSQGQLLVAPNTVGAPIAANWHVDGTGDLNGDGRSDIILRDQDGALRELLMNGFNIQTDQSVGTTESQDFTVAAHHYNLI
jgi:hypothetical protein